MHTRKINLIGAIQGSVTLNLVTTNIKEALEGVKYIMIVTQAHAHEIIARECAPYLEDGQIITIFPDNAGSLIFKKVLCEEGVNKDIKIGGTYTLPYGCRKKDAGTVWFHYKLPGRNPFAALPAKDNQEVADELNKIYPGMMWPRSNVLEIILQNPNITVHPIGTLLNIGRIEFSKGEFWLYKEGLTKSAWKLVEAVDKEKMQILQELGLPALPREQLRKEMRHLSREEFKKDSAKGPTSTKHRYVTEDVPIGMVFMASLGEMLGVETPTTKAIIEIFSKINETDYWKQGRTVEVCGIGNMSKEDLLKYVEEGKIK